VKRGVRTFGCAAAVLLWLAIMALPILAAVLAIRGQIELGDEEGRWLRVFMIQERAAEGVGVVWSRPLAAAPHCRYTAVRYLMWRGTGENVSFCVCNDPVTGEALGEHPCP
jgi:hypothetical protein